MNVIWDMPLCVLVADSSAATRRHLAELLQELGHRPLLAENGRQALNRLGLGGVDLILSDLILPDLGSAEFLREARGLCPETPLILLGLPGRPFARLEHLRAGMDEFLVKPVEKDLLAHRLAAVARTVELGRLRRKISRLEMALEAAGGLAHEINLPLAALTAAAEFMEELDEPLRLKELAGFIAGQSSRLGETVTRLVHLARYSASEHLSGGQVMDLTASGGA